MTACLQLKQQAFASVGIRRPFLNCMADSRRLLDTRFLPSSKNLFKALHSLRQTERYLRHLSSSMSEAQPGSGVIWRRHAPRASVRHRVTPHQARLWPGSLSGLRAAPTVRCCKWLLGLTDRLPSVPAVPTVLLHTRASSLDCLGELILCPSLKTPDRISNYAGYMTA